MIAWKIYSVLVATVSKCTLSFSVVMELLFLDRHKAPNIKFAAKTGLWLSHRPQIKAGGCPSPSLLYSGDRNTDMMAGAGATFLDNAMKTTSWG